MDHTPLTRMKPFTFDAPVASFVALNMPHSGQGSVTVSGLQFGLSEYTATGQLLSGVCSTTSWSSSTSVACLASALWDAEGSVYDVMRVVQVTVGGIVGTSTEAFSFDAPIQSHGMPLNNPATQPSWVTLSGLGFGYTDYTASVQLGSVPHHSLTHVRMNLSVSISIHAYVYGTGSLPYHNLDFVYSDVM